MTSPISFDDGAAYERFMGKWSYLAGEAFLRWLKPTSTLQWLDVGCGNGAFTELIVQSASPASVHGIDPSAAQLAFARTRPTLRDVEFREGDAMALPYPNRTFDVAVMPLVIFFLSNPAQGVAEMTRVVRPNGRVTAYSWDMIGGGFPYALLFQAMEAVAMDVPSPPSPDASRLDVLSELWTQAGLRDVSTSEIVVSRTFADFDDYWATVLGAPSVGARLQALDPTPLSQFQAQLRARLPFTAQGEIICTARANAIQGTVASGIA